MDFKKIFRRNKNREKDMALKAQKVKEAESARANGTLVVDTEKKISAALDKAGTSKVDEISRTLTQNEPTPGVNLKTLNYYCGTQLTLLNLGKRDRTGALKSRAWNELSRDLEGSIHGFLTGTLALPEGDGKDPEAIISFYWQSPNFLKLWEIYKKTEADFRETIQRIASKIKSV